MFGYFLRGMFLSVIFHIFGATKKSNIIFSKCFSLYVGMTEKI